MAMQPMFVPLVEEERVGGWVKVGEQGELEELEGRSEASGDDVVYFKGGMEDWQGA